jgi:hypothetical protein
MSERRDMSGTLGKNERREKDTHPTHTGQCLIDGKAYWISAWVKEGQSGKFFSLAFKPKEARQEPAPAISGAAFDDDIPF